jgi:hypothetical protein
MPYNKGVHQIPINQLRLDPENPRLPERLKGGAEKEVLNWMLTDATLADLMASIVENGFFGGEALIGVNDSEGNGVIIVEGNRRLASIKLLHDPSIAENKTKTVRDLAIEVNQNNTLPQELPVFIVANREEVANYLGFRHVSGVKQWPVIAKARYLFGLFHTRGWSSDIYRQLAREIGSKSVYVRRLIVGYFLFQYIEQHNFFDLDYLTEENFDLSLINDAATKYSAVAEYMGINVDVANPIETLIPTNFKEVFSWLYERDKNGQTRVGESRNLPVLNKILATDEAKIAFTQDNYTLEDAAALTALADENIRWHLQSARLSMIEAQKLVHKIKSPNRGDLRLLEEIRNSIETMRREISTKLIDSENL